MVKARELASKIAGLRAARAHPRAEL